MVRTLSSLTSFNLNITVKGTASKNYIVKVRNRRSGDTITKIPIHGRTGGLGNYDVIVNLAEFAATSNSDPRGFNNGDGVEILVSGHGYGYVTKTIDSAKSGGIPITITVTDHTSTNCPGVSI